MHTLGTLGGAGSIANAINASGEVVGYSTPGSNGLISEAFFDVGTTMTGIGTLPGYTNSFATSINSQGPNCRLR